MRLNVLLLCIVGLLVYPGDAFAYIDPGAGSTLMSVIIGLFVAVAIAVKTYWYKLKGFIFGRSSSQNKNSGQDHRG
jgi:hypothetical protein